MTCCTCTCLVLFIVTLGYPMLKTIQSFKDSDNEKRKWLLVWTIIAALFLVEKIACFLPLVPGYAVVKALFVLWLYHDNYNGALLLNQKVIEPRSSLVTLALTYLNHADLSRYL